jgi:hypothetical protein
MQASTNAPRRQRRTERNRVTWLGVPQSTERQRIGNQINAAICVRADFINVHCLRAHCDFGAYQNRSPQCNFRFSGKTDSGHQF